MNTRYIYIYTVANNGNVCYNIHMKKTYSFTLEEDLMEKLTELADGRPLSNVLNRIITSWVEKNQDACTKLKDI